MLSAADCDDLCCLESRIPEACPLLSPTESSGPVRLDRGAEWICGQRSPGTDPIEQRVEGVHRDTRSCGDTESPEISHIRLLDTALSLSVAGTESWILEVYRECRDLCEG